MKTLGLLVTAAIALSLSACMHRDCDPPGWCDQGGSTQARVCFDDRDCVSGSRCESGSCVVRPPVPPQRDGGASPDGAGTGGARVLDGGSSRDGGAGGGLGTGGATGQGTGGAGQPPVDGGPPDNCGGDAGTPGSCHLHPTPVCQFDNQCGLDGRCADGECQHACTANSGCGTGQVCSQGFCVTPSTSGGQCVFNADCGAAKTCINGSCHADCQADADCPAHDRCVAQICQPDTAPQPQCRSNGECVGVHVTEDVCVDAVCRTECASDVDCCVGSSGSVCQMGYCVTAHEAAPQCRIDADCGAAKSCIDATCG